jgi:probable F420-dependent oxidoreductase
MFSGGQSRAAWMSTARKVEDLGYSTLLMDDHLSRPMAPIAALASAAMATTRLRIGSFVFGNDFRNPAMLAKEAATLDVLSDGRFELGLGTGYQPEDYRQSGIALDSPGQRVSRLEEAVQMIKGAFTGDPYSFSGRHYTAADLVGVPLPVQRPHPPIMIGGGGRRVLSLAAREADIVAFNPRTGAGGEYEFASLMPSATDEKVGWVRVASGDRFAELELCALVGVVAVTDAPREAAAKATQSPLIAGAMTPDELLASPHALFGDHSRMVDELQVRREHYGFSYIVCFSDAVDDLAPVVAILTGR